VPHFDGSAVPDGQGTLLAVVPAKDGCSHLAIVGYLLPGPFSYGPHDGEQAAIARAPAGIIVDRDRRRVLVRGRDAGVVFQEFELLEFLMAHPHRVFAREQLLASVWTKAHEVTTRTVDIHVHRLRRKLGPAIAPCLVTVRRVGYMFRPLGT
jgi:DNA-binding response OmpR family regulator